MWTRNSVSLVLRTRRVLPDLLPASSPLGEKRHEELEAKGQDGNSDITPEEIETLAAWYGETDAEVTSSEVLRRDFSRIQRRQNGLPQVGAEG